MQRYLLVLFLCLGASRSFAADLAVSDMRGVRVTLRAVPQRIVSLSPACTELLYSLGAGNRVVGVTEYCDYPESAKKLPKVGGFQTSHERVLALRPDLVVAGISANSRAIASLEKHGLKVFAVDAVRLTDVPRCLSKLGEVLRLEAAAAHFAKRWNADLEGVRRQVIGVKPLRILFIVQAKPLLVAGAETFLDDLARAAGCMNLGSMAGQGYPAFSFEQMLAHPPDVIVASRSAQAETRMIGPLSQLRAIKTDRLIDLGSAAGRPGPRLLEVLRNLVGRLAEFRGR